MSKLSMDLSSVTTVAVDLAKHVSQIHGCNSSGRVIGNYRDTRLFAYLLKLHRQWPEPVYLDQHQRIRGVWL